jgi:hypothetical protein
MTTVRMSCDDCGAELTEKLAPNTSMKFDGFTMRMPPGKERPEP